MIYLVDKWTNVCPHQQPCVPSYWETFLICPCLQLCCNIQVAGWTEGNKYKLAEKTSAYKKLAGWTVIYMRMAGPTAT